MSKKSMNLVDIFNKGKELYNQYGDSVINTAKQMGVINESGKGKSAQKDGLLNLIDKGKKFYNQHGETIMGIAQQMGITQKLGLTDEATDEATDEVEEATVVDEITEVQTEEIEVVECTPSAPTSLKDIRQEVIADKTFEQSTEVLHNAAKDALSDITNPNAVMHAINTLGNVAQETIKYAEDQETKREEIRAMRDASIAHINALKESVQLYLERSFDERKELFSKQFECVDKALELGNIEMLAMSLSAINELAASSPFKNLADVASVQKSLTSNTEWDI